MDGQDAAEPEADQPARCVVRHLNLDQQLQVVQPPLSGEITIGLPRPPKGAGDHPPTSFAGEAVGQCGVGLGHVTG